MKLSDKPKLFETKVGEMGVFQVGNWFYVTIADQVRLRLKREEMKNLFLALAQAAQGAKPYQSAGPRIRAELWAKKQAEKGASI